jgi:hypothetical protein
MTFTPRCMESIKEVWKNAATAPVRVELTVGPQGSRVVIRVSRPDAPKRAFFELNTGTIDPLTVCEAVEEKIGGDNANVLNVEREVTRTISKITLVGTSIPAVLLAEPWVDLGRERRLIRFSNGPPTCDHCWISGHPRQLCPSLPPPVQQQCTRCSQRGHLADTCWLATAICHSCYETGHFRANCPSLVCYACSKAGHLARACPSATQQQAAPEKENNVQRGRTKTKNQATIPAPKSTAPPRGRSKSRKPAPGPRPEREKRQGSAGTGAPTSQPQAPELKQPETQTVQEQVLAPTTLADVSAPRTPTTQPTHDDNTEVRSYDSSGSDESSSEDSSDSSSHSSPPKEAKQVSHALATIQAVYDELGLPARRVCATKHGYRLDARGRGAKSPHALSSRAISEVALAAICRVIEAGGNKEAAERAAKTAIDEHEVSQTLVQKRKAEATCKTPTKAPPPPSMLSPTSAPQPKKRSRHMAELALGWLRRPQLQTDPGASAATGDGNQ